MILEDEYGDSVDVAFHEDGTVEMAVLSGGLEASDEYLGGFVLNKENVSRLVRRLHKYLIENGGDA